MPPFAVQQSLFRAYDIRGAQQYFTSDFIQALGAAFAKLYKAQANQSENDHKKYPYNNSHEVACDASVVKHKISNKKTTVVIGYDVRYGSDTIAYTLASILAAQEGLKVVNLGLITTPMMAFWAQRYAGHGIMVTASHSAKDTLGVKWLINNTSPSHTDIQALYKNLFFNTSAQTVHYHNKQKKSITTIDSTINLNTAFSTTNLPSKTVADTYVQAIITVFTSLHGHHKELHGHHSKYHNQHYEQQIVDSGYPTRISVAKLNLKVVIDCLHGATSKIAQPLFENFCQHVIMLNDTPDGSFPTGNPDPTEPNRLAELQQTVIVNEADIGLAFDGDGDRLMIVDNSGKVMAPDHLLYLLAQVAIDERPSAIDDTAAPRVLFDVKCSHHLPQLLSALGAAPIMTKTGSSLLRRQLQTRERQALFAGELSGHFIFNDGYFIVYDDAMYAGLRLLHWLAYTAMPTSTTMKHSADHVDTVALSTDLWGAPRDILLPYRLTDITRQLPTVISTADSYIPLSENASCDYPIVAHLISFCHYLQRIITEASSNSSAHIVDTVATAATFGLSSSCTCFVSQHIDAARAQQLLPIGTKLSCIDGIRLDFANGFGIVRESNTSHSLTVRFAGDNLGNLKEIQARFVALCLPFDTELAAQIAAITAE